MSIAIKKNKHDKQRNTSSKLSRIVKQAAADSSDQNKLLQARRQAKKIMQGLSEAEQIRTGKLKATSFEDHFGNL